MNKKKLVGLLAGIGMFSGVLSASASETLFKTYTYESALSGYTEADGYYDCSADVGGTAMCVDDVDFLGHKFTAALIFSSAKLIMVSLLSPFDQSLYATAIGSIGKTFSLSALSDGKSQLDIVQLAATASNRDEFTAKLSNYEAGALSGGQMTYTFFEGVDRKKKYPNVTSLMQASPDNIRAAEILLTGEGAEAALVIRFSFPKLEAYKVTAAAKKPVESF
jgi:hypothetical protein